MTTSQLYTLLLTSCAATSVTAMVIIDARGPQTIPNPAISSSSTSPFTSSPPTTKRATTHKQFRIRRTHTADLNDISSMLAMESVQSKGDTTNWNDKMQFLRAKPLLEKQLAHRLAAIEEGRKTTRRLKDQTTDDDVCLLSNDDTCHLLWANYNFRSKLRNAIFISQETSAWSSHNFDLAPTSDMLNHVMMSVEEVSTGNIAGFCEVAWLPSPSYYTDDTKLPRGYGEDERIHVSYDSLDIPQTYCEETGNSYCDEVTMNSYQHYNVPSVQCAPAIVNLVTSPSYRRMGIASRILKFASKFTRTQWSYRDNISTNLGLYVHPENSSAQSLYRKKGFSVVPSESEDGLLYMTQRRNGN